MGGAAEHARKLVVRRDVPEIVTHPVAATHARSGGCPATEGAGAPGNFQFDVRDITRGQGYAGAKDLASIGSAAPGQTADCEPRGAKHVGGAGADIGTALCGRVWLKAKALRECPGTQRALMHVNAATKARLSAAREFGNAIERIADASGVVRAAELDAVFVLIAELRRGPWRSAQHEGQLLAPACTECPPTDQFVGRHARRRVRHAQTQVRRNTV